MQLSKVFLRAMLKVEPQARPRVERLHQVHAGQIRLIRQGHAHVQRLAPDTCVTVTVTPGAALPEPATVTVNVYNATDRSGLARTTADELKAREFGLAAYRAYFVDDVNISDLAAVLDIAARVGVNRDELSGVLAGTEIKARLAAEVDLGLAVQRGQGVVRGRDPADRYPDQAAAGRHDARWCDPTSESA